MARMSKEEILSKVAEMLNENIEEPKVTRKGFDYFENKIKLNQTIGNILKESKNDKLNAFCREYADKIANGVKESRLYESFISGVSQWNWLNAVDTNLSAISDRVNKYKQEIDFSKILNIMKESESYYIVPLIEEVVLDYVNEKSATNRTVLKDRLMCFHHDPFVNEMLNILYYDRSINESLNLEDLSKQVNHKVNVEKIYSPVFVIKENECVFNVKGTYYNRKGNNITRFNKSDIPSLSEGFKTLCNLINSDNVSINESCITVYGINNVAHINENGISINGVNKTNNELLAERNMAFLSNSENTSFYDNVITLNEKYNDIACIDFAKRVSLTNNKRSVDIFRIKENLSVTTHDELGRHTFYRNSNPIQTANIINEHMNLNVSNLFEELQSDSEQIKDEINSTKNSYENCINELKDRLTQLEGCGESCCDEKDVEELNKLKEEVENELSRVENDYKEYQKTSDEFLNGMGDTDSEDPALVNGVEADYGGEEMPNDTEEMPMDGEETPADLFTQDDEEGDMGADVDTSSVEEPLDANTKEYDGIFDETPYYEEKPTQSNDPYEPSIVNISYAENIKTGTIVNRGEVNVLIPSVDANGDIKNELQRITFTLDAERNPIINNEYMPVALYNKIKDAILANEQTQNVEIEGAANNVEEVPTTQYDDIFSVADEQEPVEVDYNTPLFTDDEDGYEEGDTNPIDAAYGTDEEDYTNDNTEYNDMDSENNAEIVEPELTEDPAPEDLEAAGDSNAVRLMVSQEDLYENGIKDEYFVAFLKSHNISGLRGTNGMFRIVIRDYETYNAFREFFIENGWTRSEFANFFPELSSFERMHESKVVVKYSPKMESLLESNNLLYKISKRGDKIMILNAVNEGVVITVKDDKTGKTVTINTDELNDDADEEAKERDENKEGDVTFGDNQEGEEQATEETTDSEETTEETPNESNEGGSNPDEKTSKKFRIKKKKTNESLGHTVYSSLNENEDVEVCDTVKYKNKNGNVVSKLSNGDVIVDFGGETDILKPKSIKLNANDDSKYTKDTLNPTDVKNVNESYCGIFLNGVRISPANCLTNTKAYKDAKEEDLINIVVEGVSSEIKKQYVKLLS